MTASNGSPAPEPTAAAPHKIDTRTKFYVALIALVASILGGITGAGGAIGAANINSKTQREVAAYNQLESQRLNYYSSYVAQSYRLNQATTAVINSFDTPADLSTINAAFNAYDAQYYKTFDIANILALIGSDQAKANGNALDYHQEQYRNFLVAGVANLRAKHPLTYKLSPKTQAGADGAQIGKDLDQFIHDAGVELASVDLK